MADIRTSGMGGVPKGATADRPSSPSIGDVFYNGTLGCLEIYTSQGWVANSAPPGIPTIGTATYSATNKAYNNSSASIAFTPGEGGGLPNLYRATSTPGGFSGTGTSSPITVTGLQSATDYTFSVTGTNNFGTSAGSTNSNSITANTVPQAPGTPVAAYASNTSVTLTFTAGATGGASITNYKYSTDGVNYTAFSPAQNSSPVTITGLTAFNTYTFYIKAINENGDSAASLVSNSVFMGPVVTGGTLASDSTYYYRTFTGNGTLAVSNASLTADILIVAGGGPGGGNLAGGGGAGGYKSYTSYSVPAQSHTITVGAGGARVQGSQQGGRGSNGTNTSLGSIFTCIGGGAGGSGEPGTQFNGLSGGSGGGSTGYTASVTRASGTSGQGYDGGISGRGSPNYPGAGGGGSSAQGEDVANSSSRAGDGGAGTLNAILGANYYWAAGGGGGIYTSGSTRAGNGGIGGGGGGGANGSVAGTAGGSAYNSGSNGTAVNNGSTNGGNTGGDAGANTGSGGGGACHPDSTGGAGGSGIVVFRYTKAAVGG